MVHGLYTVLIWQDVSLLCKFVLVSDKSILNRTTPISCKSTQLGGYTSWGPIRTQQVSVYVVISNEGNSVH